MLNYFWLFALGIIFSVTLTPLVKIVAYRFNVLDNPDHRKIHDNPIPLLGGIVIFLSVMLTLLFAGLVPREVLVIFLVSLIFVAFGLLDDAGIKIRARYKIWSHLAFSFLFVYLSGVYLDFFRIDLINWVLTACFITFMTNSFNMLDGMDGLVTGITCIAAGFFFLFGITTNQVAVSMISIVICGACLGFLRYNFNPATIFLGEAGSTLLGFLMAFLAIKLYVPALWTIALNLKIANLSLVGFIIPLVLLGIPIFDTYFVFVNRFFHHVEFSTPGKDHSHHRIHLMGLSHKNTVLILYMVQIVLGLIAYGMVNSTIHQFFAMLGLLVILTIFATVFLTQVKVYDTI